MLEGSTMKRSMILRASAVAVVLGAAGMTPAQAQLDPLVEALTSLGLKESEKESIDYRERAPLVVPQGATKLRPPEQSAGARNPAWPNDPDVAARRARAAEARKSFGVPSDDKDPAYGGLVGPAEGRRRNANAGVPTQGSSYGGGDGPNPTTVLNPDQVRNIMANSVDASVPTGVEPKRQYLTEPPTGYRRAAAGAPVRASVEPMRPQNDDVQINALRPSN